MVLSTIFGTVVVGWMVYRAQGVSNLHPADAVLNLPIEGPLRRPTRRRDAGRDVG